MHVLALQQRGPPIFAISVRASETTCIDNELLRLRRHPNSHTIPGALSSPLKWPHQMRCHQP
jgi:hypothetical protein